MRRRKAFMAPRVRRGVDVAALIIGLGVLFGSALGLVLRNVVILWRPIVLLTSLAGFLALLAVPALIGFALARRRVLAAIGAVLTAGAVWTQLPLYVASGPSVHGPGLTVMQFNEHSNEVTAATIAAEVRQRRVDLLAVEELNSAQRVRLQTAGVDAQLPFHYYPTTSESRIGQVGLWSKYPITDSRDLDQFSRGGISVTVSVPGSAGISVAVLHLASPAVDSIPHWRDDLGRVRDLSRTLSTGSRPVILLGDFNANLEYAGLRAVLRNGYQDAVEQAGAGYLPTYPSTTHYPPVIAIDHVILRKAKADSALTVTMPGALHRALIVKLRLSA